jgi:hypothetical protein
MSSRGRALKAGDRGTLRFAYICADAEKNAPQRLRLDSCFAFDFVLDLLVWVGHSCPTPLPVLLIWVFSSS